MTQGSIDVVLLDLDGVVRLFDLEQTTAVETRHGLTPMTLIAAAFDEEALHALVRGRTTKRAWLDGIAARTGAPAAVEEWAAQPVTVDADVVALAQEVRATGRRVVLLTNGTDESRAEVGALGLLDSVDGLLVSAEIGEAKPDRALFDHVAAALGADHAAMLLVDDSRANVEGAVAAGLHGHLHTDAAALRAELERRGAIG
ncbi:HAD-IA family hydrolase [uncultured Nocardioides sp.]|uniref:HAD family hydrolase n=1 Tax=uncultured Nocardioides sp. TaxID=198441 RepID=UPI002624CCA4|nr:HAD-IA family hydrolase [uncultured Nocardioides sp.]